MTPEQLEEVPGIAPESVENIEVAVNSYYGQFETEAPAAVEETAEPEAATGEEVAAEPAEPAAEAAPAGEKDVAQASAETDSVETPAEIESGTMKGAE